MPVSSHIPCPAADTHVFVRSFLQPGSPVSESSYSRRDLLRDTAAAAALLALPRPVWSLADGSAAREHLEVALRAQRWIRRARIESGSGVVWPADPLRPQSVSPSLYNGYAGIVVFLLELHAATGQSSYLDEAVRGARSLAATLPAVATEVADAGLYTGLAGIAFVVGEAARLSKDAQLQAAARRGFELVKAAARPIAAGVEWNSSNDIIAGSAGIGLYLLRAADRRRDEHALELAARAGRRLLEVAQPAQGGLKWQLSPSVTNQYPNFSHGAAGVGFFLASLYGVTRDHRFLEGALGAARYLDAVALKDQGSWRVFHHEPGGEQLYYLSWCHGPAGTARLFYRLNQVAAHDRRWHDHVIRCAKATTDLGAPVQRSAGYWNNISQCCGNGGVGEFFLSMHDAARKPEYLEVARRAAADTLARATEDGDGLKWVQAENRTQPNNLIAQTGFMQGAAGVGTFFLHMDGREQGRAPAVVFPDNPFSG